MRKQLSLSGSLLVIGMIIAQSVAPANTSTRREADLGSIANASVVFARLGDQTKVQAARRGNPFINLTDGRELLTDYASGEQGGSALMQGRARGLSLTADDFDGDGAQDLVCGFVAPDSGGLVVLHRGNSDLIRPNVEAPFHAPARVFALAVAAEFLGTGDFDADGHRDVVAASSTEGALYLLRGNGRLALGEPERIELPGRVTALVTGEMNRADGLADVVVGVAGNDGPKLLVFEGPGGALRLRPEVIALPAEATSLAIGQLDNGFEYDLAAAAGSELIIVHGRVRELSGLPDAEAWIRGEPASQTETGESGVEERAATITREYFSFDIAGVAIGDFGDDGSRRDEIAVMSEDGRLHYLRRSDAEAWQVMNEAGVGEISNGQRLVTTKLSSFATDDLLVTNLSNQVGIISGGPGSKRVAHEMTMLDAEGETAAVLPMRLSGHALNDLVILKADGQLAVSMVTPMSTFTVTNTNDSGPGSLRQAILDANSSLGLDAITFNIPTAAQNSIAPMAIPIVNPLAPLPVVSDPVNIGGVGGTIDPVTKKLIVTINGRAVGTGANGLTITAAIAWLKDWQSVTFPVTPFRSCRAGTT